MDQPINLGDMVRENWSGFPGIVVGIEQDEAIVQYPNGGRRLRSRLECLVPVSLGPKVTAAVKESPAPNFLLARYRRIRAQLDWFGQELDQDYELFRAGGKDWAVMEALRLRPRTTALMGLSDTFSGFAFTVPMGDFTEDEWQKVYANRDLVDGSEEYFSKMEEQCNLYAEATISVHRQFAEMSQPIERTAKGDPYERDMFGNREVGNEGF